MIISARILAFIHSDDNKATAFAVAWPVNALERYSARPDRPTPRGHKRPAAYPNTHPLRHRLLVPVEESDRYNSRP